MLSLPSAALVKETPELGDPLSGAISRSSIDLRACWYIYYLGRYHILTSADEWEVLLLHHPDGGSRGPIDAGIKIRLQLA